MSDSRVTAMPPLSSDSLSIPTEPASAAGGNRREAAPTGQPQTGAAAPHLPVLRLGEPYASLDRKSVARLDSGETAATISMANAAMIRRDMRRMKTARDRLRSVPAARLLEMCARAAELFIEATLPLGDGGTQTPEDYIEALSATNGLPHSLCRANMEKLRRALAEMPSILNGLMRGLDIAVLDRGWTRQNGVTVSYHAVADALGVALPSNSPGVNSLWLSAVPLKIPVVLKPGGDEPWTPFRLVQSLLAAGCPPEALSFYPTDHEGSASLIGACERALVFGDEKTIERYAGNPAIQVHGPGRSKLLIGADMVGRWPEWVDVIVESIASNGGRSCVNASTIVVPSHADEIARAVARRVSEIRPRSIRDPDAVLCGFANPRMAESVDRAIDEELAVDGAVDFTSDCRSEPRRMERDGLTFLLPTVVRCRSMDHPLANREFLFPFASVVELPPDEIPNSLGSSLVVTAITEDPSLIRRLLDSPLIDRLNIGPIPTPSIPWDQPHEGNLFEFLYRRRSIQFHEGSLGAVSRI